MRKAVVFGLLHAGLAVTRSLGRAGVPVTGISWNPHDFGLKSRYLTEKRLVEGDRAVLDAVRAEAAGGRVVLFPERDEHVEWALDHWDDANAVADMPLPADREAVVRLRRKDVLPRVAAEAGVPSPGTVLVDGDDAVRDAGLRAPMVVKAVEGQEFALTFGQKALVAESVDEALAVARVASDRGFQTIVQEIVPDSHERIYSLLAYVARDGRPLVTLVGRKVRQGPLRFGTSAVFEVDFAHDPRDGEFRVLEVNTRLPVWAALAANRHLDLPRIVYDDLSGREVSPLPTFKDDLTWVYLAKDVHVSLQMARRRELGPRRFLREYLRQPKARAIFARDDPLPAVASLAYLRSRTP